MNTAQSVYDKLKLSFSVQKFFFWRLLWFAAFALFFWPFWQARAQHDQVLYSVELTGARVFAEMIAK